jgi:hypothetical protein
LICEANRAIHVKPNPLKVWCFDVSKTVAAGLIIAWAAWLLMVYKAVPATSPAATTTQVKEKAQ